MSSSGQHVCRLRDRKTLVASLPPGGVVAEIGVQRGRFAKVIYRKAKPRMLHLIDCWEHQEDEHYDADTANVTDQRHLDNYHRVEQRLARGIRSGRVRLHKGYSVPVLATFPDGYFDWVYVDANHTYEGVKADLEACLPKLKSEGIIAGHDYIDTPYWKALNYGVVEAVDEFCARHDWELIYLTTERGNEVDRRGNPSFAIRKAGLRHPMSVASGWFPFGRRRRAA